MVLTIRLNGNSILEAASLVRYLSRHLCPFRQRVEVATQADKGSAGLPATRSVVKDVRLPASTGKKSDSRDYAKRYFKFPALSKFVRFPKPLQ